MGGVICISEVIDISLRLWILASLERFVFTMSIKWNNMLIRYIADCALKYGGEFTIMPVQISWYCET